jgi:hypothetical protein
VDPSEHEQEKIERLRRAMYSRVYADKLQPRERREMAPPHEEAPEDFVRPEPHFEGSIIAPVGLTIMRNALWWLLGIAVVFFVGATAFFVYYFLFGAGSLPASPNNISIVISGPPQIQGGDNTELQVVVQNHNRAALQGAELVLSYPQGTRSLVNVATNLYSCNSPQNTSDSSLSLPQQRICLGDIPPGGTRQGTVAAIFSGIGGQHQTIKADLEYRLVGSSALFVASTDYDLAFGSSPLSLSVDGNTQTISGQPVQLTVNIASNASAPIKDVLLSAVYPFGFKVKSATPAPASDGFWQLGDLYPGGTKSVVIQGVLTGQSGDDRVFNFTAGTRSTTTVQSIETPLSTLSQHLAISQPFLTLGVSVNGSASSTSAIVVPGDTVNVVVSYQNNLSTPITDAIIVAKLTGTQFDGSTVRSTDGFYRSTDSSMIWNKTTTNGSFTSLAPGEKGTVGFSFQAPTSTQLLGTSAPHVTISINAAGNRVAESGVPETLLSSVTQQVGIATDLEFTAQGLYYSNPFGSTGPLPPKAGTETSYALLFSITNTTNKITNATLTATLPPYVRWLNVCAPAAECPLTGGRFRINPLDSTMTWSIGDIDPGVGLAGVPPKQLVVAIGMTPSTSQVGTTPALLQNISLSGIDDATGNKITIPLKDEITTDLTRVAKSASSLSPGIDAGFTSASAPVVK